MFWNLKILKALGGTSGPKTVEKHVNPTAKKHVEGDGQQNGSLAHSGHQFLALSGKVSSDSTASSPW